MVVTRRATLALCLALASAAIAPLAGARQDTSDQPIEPLRVKPASGDRAVQAERQTRRLPLLETGLEEGRTATYEIRRAVDYAEQMGDNEQSRSTTSQNTTIRLAITVDRVNDAGDATVSGRFLSVSSRIEDEEGAVSVDFDLEADLPDDARDAPGLDAMRPALKDARFEFDVNADGNVTDLSGVPDVAEIAGDDVPPGLLASLRRETFATLLSKLFNAEGGVQRTRESEAGATAWTTVENIDLGESGEMVITRSWRPEPREGGTIEATGQFGISIQAPENPADTAPRGEVAEYRGNARLIWREDGGLNFLTSTEMLAMRWTLGSVEVRSTQESTTTIRRTDG